MQPKGGPVRRTLSSNLWPFLRNEQRLCKDSGCQPSSLAKKARTYGGTRGREGGEQMGTMDLPLAHLQLSSNTGGQFPGAHLS